MCFTTACRFLEFLLQLTIALVIAVGDNLNIEDRKKNMRAIHSTNTKMEINVSKRLWNRGLRFRKNVKNLFGKPDIAIKKYKIVIFLDSCFWHQCRQRGKHPKTNKNYWNNKLYRNVERDKEVNEYYKDNGWFILRIWEHEVKEDLNKMVDKIYHFINSIKSAKK